MLIHVLADACMFWSNVLLHAHILRRVFTMLVYSFCSQAKQVKSVRRGDSGSAELGDLHESHALQVPGRLRVQDDCEH